MAGAEEVASADDVASAELEALVELSLEHADRPRTAIAAMVAAVSVLR